MKTHTEKHQPYCDPCCNYDRTRILCKKLRCEPILVTDIFWANKVKVPTDKIYVCTMEKIIENRHQS